MALSRLKMLLSSIYLLNSTFDFLVKIIQSSNKFVQMCLLETNVIFSNKYLYTCNKRHFGTDNRKTRQSNNHDRIKMLGRTK